MVLIDLRNIAKRAGCDVKKNGGWLRYYKELLEWQINPLLICSDGLKQWRYEQRQRYHGRRGPPLKPWKLTLLQKVNFKWKAQNHPNFDTMLKTCDNYWKKHGPNTYPKDNLEMKAWIENQKIRYFTGTQLSNHCLKKRVALEKIGFQPNSCIGSIIDNEEHIPSTIKRNEEICHGNIHNVASPKDELWLCEFCFKRFHCEADASQHEIKCRKVENPKHAT